MIEYARLHPGTATLLDDRAARRVAETMGIPVYGTLSIIAMQVLKDPALSFEHLVIRIQEAGLYLNENLIESVRKKLKEKLT